jgi:hypothetical protein
MNSREMIRARTCTSMMTRLALLLGIWLATSGSTSCSFNSGSSSDDDPPASGGSFTSTLTLRDAAGVETASFVFGEPVRFDFEIVNRTDRQQRLSFPDAQTHDFLVINDQTVQVRWMWSDGQAFAQASTELRCTGPARWRTVPTCRRAATRRAARWSSTVSKPIPWHPASSARRSRLSRSAENSRVPVHPGGLLPRIDGSTRHYRSPP